MLKAKLPAHARLTEGSSRWRTASGVSFASKTRSDAGRQLLDQIGLGPLPEEPRALVGCEAHTGALPLGELGSDKKNSSEASLCQNSGSRHKNLPPLALERTSPKFHMLAWLVILFCLRLKKDWSERAKLLCPGGNSV